MVHSRPVAAIGGLLLSPPALIGFAPAALATNDPGPRGPILQFPYVPPPPPVQPESSVMPVWAILAIVACTMLIATATTLITLAIDRARHPYPVTGSPEPADAVIFPDLTEIPGVEILERA